MAGEVYVFVWLHYDVCDFVIVQHYVSEKCLLIVWLTVTK